MVVIRKVIDSAAIATMRRYLSSRIGLRYERGKEKELEEKEREFIRTLDNMEVPNIWDYANEKEKNLARKILKKYKDVLDYLTTENVLKWLMIDVPIAYGILVAHPNGIRWLDETINTLKESIINDLIDIEVV